jgi:glycogen debranching enzyme
VAAETGALLGQETRSLREKAAKLKAAINTHFWQPAQGYYGYFLDEHGVLSPKMEGLGEAFAILTGVANEKQGRQILKATPTTQWGFPCLWPQFEEWRDYKRDFAHYYHNGMIWPFVEGYWAWAATRLHDAPTFGRELDALIKLSEKNDTFMELYRPENGQPDGSPRQLWSASGFLSMIYHGLFGMEFTAEGIRFAPVVPKSFERLTLDQMKYRNANLRIVVKGEGTRIQTFKLDGKKAKPVFPANQTGAHEIEILLR